MNKTDYQNPQKQATRVKKLEMAKALWGNPIECDWLELPGGGYNPRRAMGSKRRAAPTLSYLRAEAALKGKFIGLDTSRPIVQACKAVHGTKGCEWYWGNAFEVFGNDGKSFNPTSGVGVFDLDTTMGLARFLRSCPYAMKFVEVQRKKLGKFALFLNLAGGTEMEEAERVQVGIHEFLLKRFGVKPAIDIYRGEGHQAFMVQSHLMLE